MASVRRLVRLTGPREGRGPQRHRPAVAAATATPFRLDRLLHSGARGRTGGRKPKMTPALTNKAQRMYDSRQFTMAEIAASCGVTPMTIYRNIKTNPAATTT